MRIYGAGLAGLIAANMLRRYNPEVHELLPELPNNHHALLRFRTDAVSRATGIPFRKVCVQKAIWYRGEILEKADLRLANMYSSKVTGSVRSRSILNLEPGERWIAPPDLVQQLAAGANIIYSSSLAFLADDKGRHYLPEETKDETIISTIPMPVLMELSGWNQSFPFSHRGVWTMSCHVLKPEVDAYQTLYYPSEHDRPYRASLTGNLLQVESMEQFDSEHIERTAAEVLQSGFGVSASLFTKPQQKCQRLGKILPIEDTARKQFILAMSDIHNIYSLGRFATWRQLQLDDIVHDVQVIEQLSTQRDSYSYRLAANSNL